jgi:TetR/AcrR family transcriptional repressor of multidrug resistance operon
MRIRDVNKEHIIKEKALELIVKEGFDGFSMQKLAKLAGVSPATLYIYHKDKEGLIINLAVEILKDLFDQSLNGFDPSMSFAEGLKIQWKNRASYGIQYPDEVYFMEQIRHSPFHDKVMALTGNNFSDAMKQFVMNAIQRKELIRVPLEVLWSIAYAPLYTLITFHNRGRSLGGKEFSFSEEIMDKTFELVLKALKP